MASDLAKMGIFALAVAIISPQGRKHLGGFLNELAEAAERERRRKEAWIRETQRKEAERRVEIALAALQNYFEPNPVDAQAPIQQRVPAIVEPDKHWLEVIIPPAVVLVLGKRGSGKSALTCRLLELFRYRLSPYVVGSPAQANKLLPDWIGTVPKLEDLPPNCIALVDEAYIHFHSRRSMAQESSAMSKQLNLSRQRNQTLIFVSQEARQVDRNIASSASVVVFKEMGMLQSEFERPELRKLVNEAADALATVGKNKKKWSYVFSPDADHLGLLESQLPSFWKPSMSRLYAGEPSGSSQRTVAKMNSQEKATRAQELRANGYTYSQIMKELGVSKATVVNYLKGYPYRPK